MNEEIVEIDGIAVRTEKIEFDASELLTCEPCGRANAPNRAECMYCGAVLAGVAASTELKLREVEPWEKAFNLILASSNLPGEIRNSPIDTDLLARAATLGPPIPIGRVAGEDAAGAVLERLKELGVDVIVVSDEELREENAPTRLRSIVFEGDALVLTTFNTGESLRFPNDELELIVVGRFFEERSEQTLKKRRKGVKEVDSGSVSKDSAVIDIYFKSETDGFRVLESGFDFSCLGEAKSYLAAENIKKLVERLTGGAHSARVSIDYASKRGLIENVWPSVVRNDSKGVRRARFGVSLSKAEVTTNTEQFTKYSRLVRRSI